jgi:hypothetical protein
MLFQQDLSPDKFHDINRRSSGSQAPRIRRSEAEVAVHDVKNPSLRMWKRLLGG